MLTKICTLKFVDGHVITATVTVATPNGRRPVTYTGDIGWLNADLPARATPNMLDAHFSALAEDLEAEYTAEQTCTYDAWPE